MARLRSLLVVLLAMLLVFTGSATAAAPMARSAAAPTTLASGLSYPWGIAPLPDGRTALITERDSKRIWLVGVGRTPTVVYTVTEAVPGGEGGLLGITPAPDFQTSKIFFVYYTTATDNRVARLVYGSTARPVPIVTGIPKGQIHNGGGLIYKKGGYLFIGTGDAGDSSNAQNTASLGGKVLKVDSNGNQKVGADIEGNAVVEFKIPLPPGYDAMQIIASTRDYLASCPTDGTTKPGETVSNSPLDYACLTLDAPEAISASPPPTPTTSTTPPVQPPG
jgi:hypothetical protein